MTMPIGPTPTPAPEAPPAPPTADPAVLEQVRQQVLKEVFGENPKYKSVEDARKGYWEQNKYIGQLESLVANTGAPTAPAVNDPFKRLADESLIPIDAFRQGVKAIVDESLGAVFGPISGALQAREQLVATAPQYAEDEAKVLAFANSHPELQQRVQAMTAAGFPFEALKIQYSEYLAANPHVSAPVPPPGAGLPNTPGSTANRAPGTGNEAEDAMAKLKAALGYALQTKNENALWNEVFSDFKVKLPPGFQLPGA